LHLFPRVFVGEVDERKVLVELNDAGVFDRRETGAWTEFLGNRVTEKRTVGAPEIEEETVYRVSSRRHEDGARR
jgi:hypothetical protein